MRTIKICTLEELKEICNKDILKADIIQAAWKLLYDSNPWNEHERETFCIEFQIGFINFDCIELVYVNIGSLPTLIYSVKNCENATEALRKTNKIILKYIKKMVD
jgi:hypothetical protein